MLLALRLSSEFGKKSNGLEILREIDRDFLDLLGGALLPELTEELSYENAVQQSLQHL